MKAYPALVDEKDSVAIQLVEPVVQQQLMWAGQRRLVLLNAPSPSVSAGEGVAQQSQAGALFQPVWQGGGRLTTASPAAATQVD